MRERGRESVLCAYIHAVHVLTRNRDGSGQYENVKTKTFQRDEESNAVIFWIDREVSLAWLDQIIEYMHTLEPPMSRTPK